MLIHIVIIYFLYLVEQNTYTIEEDPRAFSAGDWIAVKPPLKQYEVGIPWIGEINKDGVKKRTITFTWCAGSYTSSWRIGIYESKNVASMPKKSVLCKFTWSQNGSMPKGLVKKLQSIIDD